MANVQLSPRVFDGGQFERVRYPTDDILLRVTTGGIGAPYDGFARDMSALLVEGTAQPSSLVEVAGKHGVRLGESD